MFQSKKKIAIEIDYETYNSERLVNIKSFEK